MNISIKILPPFPCINTNLRNLASMTNSNLYATVARISPASTRTAAAESDMISDQGLIIRDHSQAPTYASNQAVMTAVPEESERDVVVSVSATHGVSQAAAKFGSKAELLELPKELIDEISDYLDEEDLGALSATSRQLESKVLKQRFKHVKLYPNLSTTKLEDVENIVSHQHFGPAIRSVTFGLGISWGNATERSKRMPKLLQALQKAPNLTKLAVECGDLRCQYDFAPYLVYEEKYMTLPILKKLTLTNGMIELEDLLYFIEAQPKIEELHIERFRSEDEELGDIHHIDVPGYRGAGMRGSVMKGFRVSSYVEAHTAVKHITIDEKSNRIWGDDLSGRWTDRAASLREVDDPEWFMLHTI